MRLPNANNHRETIAADSATTMKAASRQPNGSWSVRDVDGLDATLVIPCINVSIPMADVYDRVGFVRAPSELPVPRTSAITRTYPRCTR